MPRPHLALSVIAVATLALQVVQALVPTSCAIAHFGGALKTLDTGVCHQAPPRMVVHDQVISADICQQLIAPFALKAAAAPNTQDITMQLPVPKSLYKTIMSLLNSGTKQAVEQGIPTGLNSESKVRTGVDMADNVKMHDNVVLVPARVSSKSVPLHQDRHRRDRGGNLVEGYSAVLYLQGGGKMTFVDADTRVTVGEVDIVPGRMLVWENGPLMHQLDAGDSPVTRVMIGPMSVDTIGELVGVGEPAGRRCNPGKVVITSNDGVLMNPSECCLWSAGAEGRLERFGTCFLATDDNVYLQGLGIKAIPSGVLDTCGDTVRSMNLNGNQINRTSLECVTFPASLTNLYLNGNQLTSLAGVTFPASITYLDLTNNQLNDTSLVCMPSFPNLKTLLISGNIGLTCFPMSQDFRNSLTLYDGPEAVCTQPLPQCEVTTPPLPQCEVTTPPPLQCETPLTTTSPPLTTTTPTSTTTTPPPSFSNVTARPPESSACSNSFSTYGYFMRLAAAWLAVSFYGYTAI